MSSLVQARVRAAQSLDAWCLPIGRSLVVTALDAHDLPLGFVFPIRDPSPVLVVPPTQVNVTHVWKVDRIVEGGQDRCRSRCPCTPVERRPGCTQSTNELPSVAIRPRHGTV